MRTRDDRMQRSGISKADRIAWARLGACIIFYTILFYDVLHYTIPAPRPGPRRVGHARLHPDAREPLEDHLSQLRRAPRLAWRWGSHEAGSRDVPGSPGSCAHGAPGRRRLKARESSTTGATRARVVPRARTSPSRSCMMTFVLCSLLCLSPLCPCDGSGHSYAKMRSCNLIITGQAAP